MLLTQQRYLNNIVKYCVFIGFHCVCNVLKKLENKVSTRLSLFISDYQIQITNKEIRGHSRDF